MLVGRGVDQKSSRVEEHLFKRVWDREEEENVDIVGDIEGCDYCFCCKGCEPE